MSEKKNEAGGASGQGGQKFRQESNQERLNKSKLRMESGAASWRRPATSWQTRSRPSGPAP